MRYWLFLSWWHHLPCTGLTWRQCWRIIGSSCLCTKGSILWIWSPWESYLASFPPTGVIKLDSDAQHLTPCLTLIIDSLASPYDHFTATKRWPVLRATTLHCVTPEQAMHILTSFSGCHSLALSKSAAHICVEHCRDSPLTPQLDRILQIGDASGIQSPLSFGGFGALSRHLPRLKAAIVEALNVS